MKCILFKDIIKIVRLLGEFGCYQVKAHYIRQRLPHMASVPNSMLPRVFVRQKNLANCMAWSVYFPAWRYIYFWPPGAANIGLHAVESLRGGQPQPPSYITRTGTESTGRFGNHLSVRLATSRVLPPFFSSPWRAFAAANHNHPIT